jgi:hypothetical protein
VRGGSTDEGIFFVAVEVVAALLAGRHHPGVHVVGELDHVPPGLLSRPLLLLA